MLGIQHVCRHRGTLSSTQMSTTKRTALEATLAAIGERFSAPARPAVISLENFSTLFDRLPIGAYRSSVSGRQLRANAALVKLNGYSSEAQMLASVNDISSEWYVAPDRRDDFKALLERDGQVVAFVSEIYRHKTRERIWVSENSHVVHDEFGDPLYFEGTVEDITGRIQANNLIESSERRFRALTEKAQLATVLCDPRGKMHFVSAGFERLLGYRASDVEGANLFDFMHVADAIEERQELQRVALGTNTGVESIMRFHHTDGRVRRWASIANNCLDDEAVGAIVLHFRDVTDSQVAEERLRHLATTDSLTGIANRARLEEVMASAIDAAKDIGGKVALVFLDLDHFKVMNDSYGHAFGDKLLHTIAAKLKQSTGWDNLVARLGGDEFAILVPQLSNADALTPICQNILQILMQTMRIDGFDVSANASAGASIFPDDASSPAELLQHADLAMFSAKANGRNTYRRFSPDLARDAKVRGKLVNDLRAAVAQRQFVVWYQPQYDLATHKLIGFEALVRWQHPARGIVLPDEFIATAEDQGLIDDIGTYVTEQAIAQTARWSQQHQRPLRIAINVSAQELRGRAYAERLHETLRHHNMPPDRVDIEITERVFVDTHTYALEALKHLRSIGVKIALDDWGVAYSAISYLRKFPVDVVKLDRAFIGGLPESATDRSIVRALLTLARDLQLRVVAEGIERLGQLSFLQSHGCPEGQGFFFSKALSAEEVEAFWLKDSA